MAEWAREVFKSVEGPFGYRLSRFVGEVPERVLCRVCLNVARNPVQCLECSALYCQYCSRQIERSYCLACAKSSRVKTPNQRTLRQLGKLRIQCIYYPCTAVTSLRDKKQHQIACLHKLIMCYRRGCVNMGNRRDFVMGVNPKIGFCSEKCKILHEFMRAVNTNQKQLVLSLYRKTLQSVNLDST